MPHLKAHNHKELKPEELKWTCDPEIFETDSTSNLKPIEGIVGQERALKALRLGVDLRSPGYNIFITGLSGTGKFTSIKNMLETIDPECKTIEDYCYVNNFKDEDRPMLLTFPAGKGKEFKTDMANTINFLQENIPHALEANPFQQKKEKLNSEFGKKQQELILGFEDKLSKDGFALGQVKVGELPKPEIMIMIDKQPIQIIQLEEFVREKKISKQKAETIVKKYSKYQTELQSVFKKAMKLGQEYKQRSTIIERETVKDVVKVVLNELSEKYKNEKLTLYLEQVEINILNNLDVFKGQRPTREETAEGVVVDYLREYEVNVILDNTELKECPVVIESAPSYTNLFGTIEKFGDGSGGWYSDFTSIKAGSLLRANSGYIVLNAMDVFTEAGVWKTLKRVVLNGKLEIQELGNQFQISSSILKPEPIAIDTKIILIGNNEIYSILSQGEPDFNKIFKIKADFDYEMKRSDSAIIEYARIIKKLIEEEKLLEFDKTALAKIAEYGARYAGEQNKLTTRFAYIADIAREASFWARDVNEKMVTSYHVIQAYEAMRERQGLYESKLSEMIKDGTILIDTSGSRIGQINGLAVYGTNNHSFGKPTRITASVALGNGNIVNVEREAGLSGNTHNKGVLIIAGYFRENFGNKIPLSFTASLVFEQGYGMIDGDSASVTEICALLSCLADVPIKQSLAITGSVNQKGDIQPIGGVNEKIEGFFDVCKLRGLTGKEGVIIPHQNQKDLMLKEEIIKAVSENKFHIYPVKNVDEAIEILTAVKAGKLLRNGKYEPNTIYGLVEKKLLHMRKLMKPVPNIAQKKTPERKHKK
ncbi:MAG: peptidase [Ignavibacteria bacterium GWB2_35_6b]|nr:MAG: peptidase [Ignavibacteria bacterium GWB2_35_6b]